jgi:pyruvate dehydrogenase E2 component (dihydrolipoamide acetyltransferase)
MQLKLPELGEGVHEGELVKWRVKPGDTVKDDQVLCEIMTDKATIELPSPFSGKVSALVAQEGKMVKVGEVMLDYEGKGGVVTPAVTTAAPVSAPTVTSTAPVVAASAASPVSMAGASVRAAPSTRKLARELGVDLGSVNGTGPSGRIMQEDVKSSSGSTSAGQSSGPITRSESQRGNAVLKAEERVPFKGLRKKISEKMRLSKDKAAHFTYVEEADATALVELRNQAKILGQPQGIKVTFLPIVMKTMVAALKKYPILNATLDETTQEIVYNHYYNIGLSVQTEDGLTAPVIKHVESKSILQIAREIQDVVDRARAKKLTMDDLTGGTITLTNAGSIGGLFATPVINFPEVAILGLNKISRKPVVKAVQTEQGMKEEIVIRDWTYFSISLDHRIVDGAIAAEFMKLFISYIENPALMALEA